MFDATDVEVETTRIVRTMQLGTRTHPVGLVVLVAQGFLIGGIDVAQLVPRTARPLRHDVGVAGVGLETVAEIELDGHPLAGLGQRGRRLAVGVIGSKETGA